jgi:hypothetical protein
LISSNNFENNQQQQECCDDHEFEYLQSHTVDKSTREDEYYCCKCGKMISEFREIVLDYYDDDDQ